MSGAGVARGCGWQHLAVYINLAMFYFIGMPIAMLLGFKLKLYAKVTKAACLRIMFVAIMSIPLNLFF